VARYVPAQHDEFIGDTEPFYWGLFQKPKTAKAVNTHLPFQARRRVGFISSKPTTKDTKDTKGKQVTKGGKKKK
jgi:hypothetical protein